MLLCKLKGSFVTVPSGSAGLKENPSEITFPGSDEGQKSTFFPPLKLTWCLGSLSQPDRGGAFQSFCVFGTKSLILKRVKTSVRSPWIRLRSVLGSLCRFLSHCPHRSVMRLVRGCVCVSVFLLISSSCKSQTVCHTFRFHDFFYLTLYTVWSRYLC